MAIIMNNKTLDKDRIRNELIKAMLTHVPFDGWTLKAMEQGAIDIGFEKKKTSAVRSKIFKDLFLYGPSHLVHAFSSPGVKIP